MTEYNQNQANPAGIWQHIWVTLTMKYLEQMNAKLYMNAWSTLLDYREELPPDCQPDCEPFYQKIDAIIQEITAVKGNTLQEVEEKQAYFIYKKMPKPLRELKGQITKSLFDHNWINKDFSVKPRYGVGKL